MIQIYPACARENMISQAVCKAGADDETNNEGNVRRGTGLSAGRRGALAVSGVSDRAAWSLTS